VSSVSLLLHSAICNPAGACLASFPCSLGSDENAAHEVELERRARKSSDKSDRAGTVLIHDEPRRRGFGQASKGQRA
jgi:hypothetical protein